MNDVTYKLSDVLSIQGPVCRITIETFRPQLAGASATDLRLLAFDGSSVDNGPSKNLKALGKKPPEIIRNRSNRLKKVSKFVEINQDDCNMAYLRSQFGVILCSGLNKHTLLLHHEQTGFIGSHEFLLKTIRDWYDFLIHEEDRAVTVVMTESSGSL